MTEDARPLSPSATSAARELRMLIGRLRRRFLEASDSRELTASQMAVLSRLKKGDASASDIAAAERVRPQAIAASLTVLDERGLVERRPDPHDRRRQLLSLSPTGRDFIEGRAQAGQEWLAAELDQRFTEAERQHVLTAVELLERLVRQ
ncbi:MarR family transcriptional regulator [Nocardia sp. NPDC004068]|uniref:MarR family transcriptional regulator n=1 Tax=Nocardia sp. NPDC004068 TaxID=3364303 RepID=UPI0036A6FED6